MSSLWDRHGTIWVTFSDQEEAIKREFGGIRGAVGCWKLLGPIGGRWGIWAIGDISGINRS